MIKNSHKTYYTTKGMKMAEFCRKQLHCGHRCYGVRDETVCLPCLSCYKEGISQTANDACMICYTDVLPSMPCIRLTCSHIFHLKCVKRMLERKWSGARISFAFMLCPICKTQIDHPSLKEQLEPFKALQDDVRTKALTRLQFEGLFKSDAISKPGGGFYNNPAGFAMDKYAYYACSKCGKAYYGGEGRCDHEHTDNFDPNDLICGGCVDVCRMQECPTHGKEYIEFKCRYCCSVAVFYCFGTTHFCNNCHSNHTVVTNMSRTQLPQCPAGPVGIKLPGDQCPLGLSKHPPTGDEFSLGCGLCNNLKDF